MLMTNVRKSALVLGLGVAMAGIANADIRFDPLTGEGFVGKGYVQCTFDWNNHELQANALMIEFRAASEVVTQVSWICTRNGATQTQQRQRTTTTTSTGDLFTEARVNPVGQYTGFDLRGYDGLPVSDSETDGPALNSCPASWSLTTPAGDPATVSSSFGLHVRFDPDGDWSDLAEDDECDDEGGSAE